MFRSEPEDARNNEELCQSDIVAGSWPESLADQLLFDDDVLQKIKRTREEAGQKNIKGFLGRYVHIFDRH